MSAVEDARDVARQMGIPVDKPMSPDVSAEFAQRFRARREVDGFSPAQIGELQAALDGDPAPRKPLTEDEVRSLLRECVTVVKPGEILVIRCPDLTPNQLREYQDRVTWWFDENAPGIKCLVTIGEGGQIVRQEPSGPSSPIPPFGRWRDLVGDVHPEPSGA